MKEKQENIFWSLTASNFFDELEDEEREQLKRMLMLEENKNNYLRLAQIHEAILHSRNLKDLSKQHSWQRINRHLKNKKVKYLFNISKYAAIIVFAFLLGSFFHFWDWQEEKVQYTEVNVPLGQMTDITLSDGSRVWLNSGTTMRYPNNFGKNSRNISLEGEAFFKVKHEDIPFKVKLKNSEVEVLGTAFNAVSFRNEGFSQVTLVNGSVKMNTLDGKEITQIKPSQQITLSNDLKNITLKTVNTVFYRSWTEGKIVFREERMADIIPRLERWYNVDIQYSESEIGELRFSGTVLKNKPFDQIVKAFESLLPIKIDYRYKLENKDVIIISKKNLPMKN